MICQIVVQEEYRNAVVNVAHDSSGTSLGELWFWTVSRWDI
jgi:hypothetical protein